MNNFKMKPAVFLLILFKLCFCVKEEFRQELAKVEFLDTNHVKDVETLTIRASRRGSYLTSVNLTLLYPCGDNVTFYNTYQNLKTKNILFDVKIKTCEIMKMSWVKEFITATSDVPFVCPVPPGTYHFKKFSMPPAGLPLVLTEGDFKVTLGAFSTATKKKLIEGSMIMRGRKTN